MRRLPADRKAAHMQVSQISEQAVCVATRYVPVLLHPSPPLGGAPAPPNRRNVAVVSHAQYVLTVTTAPCLTR